MTHLQLLTWDSQLVILVGFKHLIHNNCFDQIMSIFQPPHLFLLPSPPPLPLHLSAVVSSPLAVSFHNHYIECSDMSEGSWRCATYISCFLFLFYQFCWGEINLGGGIVSGVSMLDFIFCLHGTHYVNLIKSNIITSNTIHLQFEGLDDLPSTSLLISHLCCEQKV